MERAFNKEVIKLVGILLAMNTHITQHFSGWNLFFSIFAEGIIL